MHTPCRQGVVPQLINDVSGKTELKTVVAANDRTFGPQIAFAAAPSHSGWAR
jgi:hypothetical protein